MKQWRTIITAKIKRGGVTRAWGTATADPSARMTGTTTAATVRGGRRHGGLTRSLRRHSGIGQTGAINGPAAAAAGKVAIIVATIRLGHLLQRRRLPLDRRCHNDLGHRSDHTATSRRLKMSALLTREPGTSAQRLLQLGHVLDLHRPSSDAKGILYPAELYRDSGEW